MNASNSSPAARDPVVPVGDERDEPLDARLAELLAAYDELLAVGRNEQADKVPPSAIDVELRDAKACLQILEHVFPRSGELPLPLGEGRGEGESQPSGAPSPNPLPKGEGYQTLGQFEILRELGRGGGGIVFLAIDSQLGRKVALKVPYPEVLVRRDLRRRFVEEAQAAARLNHRNIIPVYGAGEIGPICYIESAYCEGPTLAEWLKTCGSPVAFETAARLVTALADAVEHAHSHGILHRDIKPSNVLLEVGTGSRGQGAGDGLASDAQDNLASVLSVSSVVNKAESDCDQDGRTTLVPKLTDFGLAKLLESERDATLTGALLGTPTYMAPEQAAGRLDEVAAATDVYGLGVILYEMIAGRPPFHGTNNWETLHSIVRDDPPLPRRFRKHVPRDLEAICLKCLEKNSALRYSQAADLSADLRRFLERRPTVARPVGWSGRAVRWTRRRPAISGLLATVLLAAIAAIIGLALHANRIDRLEVNANQRIQQQADGERARQRRYDYATWIQGAYQAWQSTDLATAMELLDRCRPQPGEEDPRGWEWYYIRRLCAGGLVTLRGHEGPVLGVAFAPDGEQLASCGADGTLRIWNATTGTLLASIATEHGQVNAVAWSGDGRLLATVGDDAVLRLWDAELRNLLAEFDTPVAANGVQKTLGANEDRIYPRGLGKIRPIPGVVRTGARLFCVAFSPDCQQIAAAGTEGVIHIWDAATRDQVRTIQAHADAIYSIAFAPDGVRLASGGDDLAARVWDWKAADQPIAVFKPEAPVVCVAFSPDGQALATADSQVTLWDLSGDTMSLRMNAHRNHINAVAFSRDGSRIASGASDKAIQLWDVPTSASADPGDVLANASKCLLRTYRGHTHAVLCVTFDQQENRLASAGKDGTIQIWDATRPQDRESLDLQAIDFSVDTLLFSPVGSTLVAASQDSRVDGFILWKSIYLNPPSVVPVQGDIAARSMAFTPDGDRVAFAILGGSLFEYDIARQGMRTFIPQPDNFYDGDYSPDGRLFAVTAYTHNSARILDAASGEVLTRVPGQHTVAFSPDGRLVATESADIGEFYSVELWGIAAGKSAGRLTGHTGQIVSIVFSADGQLLATGSADGTARLWNISDCTQRFVLRVHQGGTNKVAFLLDEKTLATAGVDGMLRLWHVATGQPLLNLEVASVAVSGMSVSADGRTLATAGTNRDGSTRVDLWHAPAEKAAQ